jgi:glyoxylase-like metal-dependent hydrolase (beta-lactamase superfamily II)
MFLKQMQVGQMAVFAYLIGDTDTGDGLVIDPAANTDGLINIAKEAGITIRYIVNTHSHVDHIAGNAEMKSKTGAEIIIHKEDADSLSSTPGMFLKMFGAKPSPPADKTVKEGDTIDVGKISLKVIHTPGHTPGGMCLYVPDYVFTGDTLFVGGVGRTDLPGGSWKIMSDSIRKKLLTLPEKTIILPGHNYGGAPYSTIGKEKETNPFLAG